MSKNVLLTCILCLLVLPVSWANSIPTGKPIVPPHSAMLLPMEKELVFDLAKLKSDPEIFEKIKSAEAKGDKTDKYYFPGLDKQLTSFKLDNFNAPPPVNSEESDDLSDVYAANPETEAEKKGRQAIDYSKVGGTQLNSLSNLGDIQDLKLPAFYIQPIGNLEAIIVLNSVTLTAEGGRLGVYVGLNIPQKGRDPQGNQKSITLIFGTEDLGFSQEGGIQVGSLLLLNNVSFELAGAQKKSVVTINAGTKTGGGSTPTFSDDEFAGTYIKFGCNGIEEFGLSGKMQFSNEWLLPADEKGDPIKDGSRVVAEIEQFSFKDWNDLLIEGAGITPFVLAKYQDLSFELTNANIDLSDTRNPGSLKFPENYVQPEGVPLELWRGVYIQTIAVTLPNPFKKRCDGAAGGTGDVTPFKDDFELDFDIQDELLTGTIPNLTQNDIHWESGLANNRGPNPPAEVYTPPLKPLKQTIAPPVEESCRIKISAKDLLIDRTGVTGKFAVSSQVPLAQGALMDKKWSWTLNDVSIDLLQSNIVGFAVAGDIILPIAKKETPLAYTAGLTLVDANNDDDYRDPEDTKTFFFNVEVNEKMEFPLWKAADVTIDANSYLNVVYNVNSKEFEAEAMLFGKMEIGKGDPEDDASVPGVKFTSLHLSTKNPFLLGGNVYVTTGASKMSGFPVQISGITLGSTASSCYLGFDITVSLMKQSDGGLSASGGFDIHAKNQTNVLGAHEWVFDRVELRNVAVTIDLPAFKGSGSLTIFKTDPTYGKGFSAYLSACVMCKEEGQGEGFELEMAAVFGCKDGLRYFLVDGYASGDKISVPLPPSPLALNGFGGGVFYHMKPDSYKDPASTPAGTAIPAGSDTSGLIYKPTSSTVFGIKFSLGVTTVGGTNTFSGKLDCIIRFGPGVELQNIMFWGVGEFVNPAEQAAAPPGTPDFQDRVKDLPKPESAMHTKDTGEAKNKPGKIGAKVGISLDFDNGLPPTLHGYAEVFFDIANGQLTGSGTMDLLADPHSGKFHIFIGGYRDGTIKVPDFLNPANEIILYPVNIFAKLGTIEANVDTYFLLGTHIPGPPPLDPEVANFFDIPVTTSNRGDLVNEVCHNNPADGSGIAFGANLKLKLEHKITKKKTFGKGRKTIANIKVQGGLGFDISLLQYESNTTCGADANFLSPHGANFFRATGRIYAYVDVTGKVFKFKIPAMGVGIYLDADIPDPNYFNARVVLKFIKKWKFNVELGEQCGRPCVGN